MLKNEESLQDLWDIIKEESFELQAFQKEKKWKRYWKYESK